MILCFIPDINLCQQLCCSSIFSESFSKKETAFSYFFLLLVPIQCLDKTFLYFFFSQSRKILSYFSKLSAILKCRKKNFVVMTSIDCLDCRTASGVSREGRKQRRIKNIKPKFAGFITTRAPRFFLSSSEERWRKTVCCLHCVGTSTVEELKLKKPVLCLLSLAQLTICS